MRLAALLLGGGVWLALSAGSRGAQAFEREWHLGAALGAAGGNDLSLSPAVGLYGAYGLSDVFDVRVELTARGYRLAEQQDPYAVSAMAGLVYKLDVLRWVPWAGVYAGYQGFSRQPRPQVTLDPRTQRDVAVTLFQQHDVALGLGGGLDYAFSRNFGCGVTVRLDQALSNSDARSFESLLRVEYRWGW